MNICTMNLSIQKCSDVLYAALIIFCGLFINGPYALITTAVSTDLVSSDSKVFRCIFNRLCILIGHPQISEEEPEGKGHSGSNH